MIAVIADDFTGAAEIGGVGIRHGYRVVIDTKVDKNTDADILIIATDTRSRDAATAAAETAKLTEELLALEPDFIYKKIDSILRGNVGEELMAQLRASSLERALLVPANPALKRTIRDGIYYYDGKPLNEFNFTHTASGNRNSADVIDLLGESVRHFTTVVSVSDELPAKGLAIGNTTKVEDLDCWVQKIDQFTVPSGGSGFFDAILRARNHAELPQLKPLELGKKVLYICGSAFADSRQMVRNAELAGQTIVYMPAKLFLGELEFETLMEQWKTQIVKALEENKKVIVAVGEIYPEHVDDLAFKIKTAVAELVDGLIRETRIDELIIEGGATAYSIIRKQQFSKFHPVNELGPGTIRMKVEENKELFLTLKPGSYSWPDAIWQY